MIKWIRKLLMYILLIVVVLQCHSLLVHTLPNRYFLYAILALLLLALLLDNKYKIKNNILFLIGCYFAVMMILTLIGEFHNIEFLFSIVVAFILFLIYLSNRNNLAEIMEAYTNIMAIIATISLFFFVFASCLHIIQPTTYYPYAEVGWGIQNYYDFYHLYCEGQVIDAFGYSGVRNMALFVEAPMLAYPLAFALYYEMFMRNKGYRKCILAIIVTAMITSFSTTGFLVLAVLFYLKFYKEISKNKVIKFIVMPALISIVIYSIIYIVQDKLVNGVVSTSIRSDDVIASMKCFLHNMITGVGYENMKGIDPYRAEWRTNAGLSTGIGGILAYGGILWGMWYAIPYVIAIGSYIVNPKSRSNMGFVILSGALLFVTVVQSRVLCTMINAICWLLILNFNINIPIKVKKILD
ncbi:hypothetical protein [Clostridium diolis]|uniref:O-antigen ligase family protein n=1 Tax=Clostridium diolis TaxID=223919 RepID=A0AAV3VZ45_9CLOT|nr:hypothetical protein [Clostridium diolis]QES72333.1 hypothetical protein F3K33_05720 [Clostridium diolis]GEA30039.1 hypothetical protein CDIOL_09620 [Clostridium diolis]